MTENMPVGMFVTELLPDGTRRFVFVSNRLLHMLGLERAALMQDWREVYANIHPDDLAGLLEPSEESWNGMTVFRWEGRVRVHGETRWFAAESNPRPRPRGGASWDGVVFDVTERRRAEAEAEAARRHELGVVREQLADLERAMKSSLMAAAVAHDVKQPLAMALFHAERLLRRLSDEILASDARAILDSLTAEARRVADSVDRMRGLLQSVRTACEPFDFGHVCRSAAGVCRNRATACGIRIDVTVPAIPVTLEGDAAQMQIAVTNLVMNAVESLEGVEVGGRAIRVDVRAGDGFAECVVGDSGPGFRTPVADDGEATSTKLGGTGMGLHIVRSVLANHRGRLSMGRSPLGGAEVRMVLPRPSRPLEHHRDGDD